MTTKEHDEARAFTRLQTRLIPLFRRIFPDPLEPRTVVVVPSMTFDPAILAKITGVAFYEERLLCLLMLLRMPHTRILFVTSLPVAPAIVDYYLHLLPGVPSVHARQRLELFTCYDATPTVPLTRKLLDRPRLVERLRAAIRDPDAAHLTCFNVTALERRLALALDIPLYGCDPALCDAGRKSGSRELFKEAGVATPDGFERLRDEHDVFSAVSELKQRRPGLRQVVVKLEEGTSGEGNALFTFDDAAPAGRELATWLAAEMPARLVFGMPEETWDHFRAKLREMGGVVECFVEGEEKRSPSAQCRIDPLGRVELISTHDQVLGGPSGQTFHGCTFPADAAYRLDVQAAGAKVAEVLRQRGAIGRFGVDFVSVKHGEGWEHHAIEINLRKGGTTYPFMMLQYLTDGTYDTETGLYLTPTRQPRFFYASDHLVNPLYRGLCPEDLIDIAVEYGLHFHAASQEGVFFHLIGALSQYGKLGLVCVAASVEGAARLYQETVDILDREALDQAEKRDEPGEVPRS